MYGALPHTGVFTGPLAILGLLLSAGGALMTRFGRR